MPWQTPSLADIRRQSRDNVAAKLPGADANVPNSPMRVLADNNAALALEEHQYLEYVATELLPDKAVDWLPRHANIWLRDGAKTATFASGNANVTGLNGIVLPIATRMGAPNGCEYETTAAVTIGTGPTLVPLISLFSGTQGNQTAGTTLSLSTAISGVDGSATVVSLEGGTETESTDSLRARVLARIQNPPMGGAAHDYVAWALSLPGVTRAWCAPKEMGIGTVTVRVMMDDLRATNDGFPLAGDLSAILSVLDTLRPVAVKDFFLVSPIAEPVSFTIRNLDPDTTAVRAAIAASVGAMIAERAAPSSASGGNLIPAQTIFREWVSAAILDAAGVYSFDLEMDDHVMPNAGCLATLGTITYA